MPFFADAASCESMFIYHTEYTDLLDSGVSFYLRLT